MTVSSDWQYIRKNWRRMDDYDLDASVKAYAWRTGRYYGEVYEWLRKLGYRGPGAPQQEQEQDMNTKYDLTANPYQNGTPEHLLFERYQQEALKLRKLDDEVLAADRRLDKQRKTTTRYLDALRLITKDVVLAAVTERKTEDDE